MTKHILPLTCEGKIEDVRNGNCTQTIRPVSESKPKNEGDLIMFHGWEGRPYRSKWSWRTDYFEIVDTITVDFEKHENKDGSEFAWLRMEREDGPTTSTYMIPLMSRTRERIARADDFSSYEEMAEWFKSKYDDQIYDQRYTVIIWKTDTESNSSQGEKNDA